MELEVRISKPARGGVFPGRNGKSTYLADAQVEFTVGENGQTLRIPCTVWARLLQDKDDSSESFVIEAGLPKGISFTKDEDRDEFKEIVLASAMVDIAYPIMVKDAVERLKGIAKTNTKSRLTLDQAAITALLRPMTPRLVKHDATAEDAADTLEEAIEAGLAE